MENRKKLNPINPSELIIGQIYQVHPFNNLVEIKV